MSNSDRIFTRTLLGVSLSTFAIGAPVSAYEPKPAPPESTNIRPANYRSEIAARLRESLKDPSSVRDPRISEPFVRNMGVLNRFVVCVSFNAKNSYGGFSGPSDYLAIFVGGRLLTISEADAGECRSAQYSSFSEIKKR